MKRGTGFRRHCTYQYMACLHAAEVSPVRSGCSRLVDKAKETKAQAPAQAHRHPGDHHTRQAVSDASSLPRAPMSPQPCRRIGWLPRVLEALSIPSISPSMTTVAGGAAAPVTFSSHTLPMTTRVDYSPPWRAWGIGEGSPVRSNFLLCITLVCVSCEVYEGLGLPDSSVEPNLSQLSISFTVLHLVSADFLSFGLTEACLPPTPSLLCSVLHFAFSETKLWPITYIILRRLSLPEGR